MSTSVSPLSWIVEALSRPDLQLSEDHLRLNEAAVVVQFGHGSQEQGHHVDRSIRLNILGCAKGHPGFARWAAQGHSRHRALLLEEITLAHWASVTNEGRNQFGQDNYIDNGIFAASVIAKEILEMEIKRLDPMFAVGGAPTHPAKFLDYVAVLGGPSEVAGRWMQHAGILDLPLEHPVWDTDGDQIQGLVDLAHRALRLSTVQFDFGYDS